MPVTLTVDMRAIIQSTHLCFAATVTADGKPNLSPKGTIRVWDDSRLFFLDLASPGTRANLAVSPWMELNVVDQLSRRGYRFFGKAAIHTGGIIFDKAVAIIKGEENADYPAAGVVLLEIDKAAPLISPGYWHVLDEPTMRKLWRDRRDILDAEFEKHLRLHGPFAPRGG
jgi:predicted pyridoxine 5'-phosphate oxidase superfamily flavin-nucleotide-binding protein